MKLRYVKVRDVKSPNYGTVGSNGIDFYIPNDISEDMLTVNAGDQIYIPSGLKLDLPNDYGMMLLDKSGISKLGLKVIAPLIDSDFQGEFKISLAASRPIILQAGMKIIQGVIIHMPQFTLIEEAEIDWKDSERKEAGFGHTGLY